MEAIAAYQRAPRSEEVLDSHPALQGVYFYGDFCTGRIWGMKRVGTTFVTRLLLETGMLISTFGEDEEGNLYVADYGNGRIYRITSP